MNTRARTNLQWGNGIEVERKALATGFGVTKANDRR